MASHQTSAQLAELMTLANLEAERACDRMRHDRRASYAMLA